MNRHPNFLGSKIAQLLSDSSQTFLQRFVDIKREYRIECAGGICPISCMDGDEDWQDIDSHQKIFDYKEDMHHFFMQCVNTIPTSLRGIPLSADITLLKNDSFVTIETNPGGNGWNVNNDPAVVKSHNRLLRRYHHMRIGDSLKILAGMTDIEQIDYLRDKLKQWNVSYEVHGIHFTELPDRLLDSITTLRPIRSERLNYKGPRPKAICYISNSRKFAAIAKGINFWKKKFKSGTAQDCEDILHHMYYLNLKSTDIISNDLATSVTSEIKSKYTKKILEIFVDPLKRFNLKFKKNGKLDPKIHKKLASMVLTSINQIDMLNSVGIEHNELKDLTKKYYKLFIETGAKFIDFDKSFKKFKKMMVTVLLNSKNLKKNDLRKYLECFEDLFEMLTKTKSAERNSFEIQLSFHSIVVNYLPELRKLYPYLINGEIREPKVFESILHAALFVIHRQSDSIYSLPKENFLPEFELFSFALKWSIKREDINYLGDIIHGLRILGANGSDINLVKDISEAQCLIYGNQDAKRGSWNGDYNLLVPAVRAFKEHPLVESDFIIGEYSSNDDYFKILEEEGLISKNKN
jgi:hypothetical protein